MDHPERSIRDDRERTRMSKEREERDHIKDSDIDSRDRIRDERYIVFFLFRLINFRCIINCNIILGFENAMNDHEKGMNDVVLIVNGKKMIESGSL